MAQKVPHPQQEKLESINDIDPFHFVTGRGEREMREPEKKNRQLNLAAPQEHIYQQVKIGCGPHELTFAPFCSENLLA